MENNHHRATVMTEDGKLGLCYLWEWKGVYMYAGEGVKKDFIEYPLNAFETGALVEIPNDDFHKIYEERNDSTILKW